MDNNKKIGLTVLVAALGYFVDIYDIQLFNVVSKMSLRGLGITDQATIDHYDYLLFLWQMGGMLVGGLLWGFLGDQKGRKSILFGSILLYSLANIANAFVVDLEQYSAVRFLAGLGLAGELGAAITLVSELMHKEKRGYGTMVIVTMGALGAVAAALISRNQFQWFGLATWQISYLIGGGLGLLLLLMRVGTFESGMFDEVKKSNVQKGNFFMLFTRRDRFKKYIACILIGLPVWYCVGVLMKFSEKFSITNHVQGEAIQISLAVTFTYLGLSAGDLLSGFLSQYFRSRKKVIFGYLVCTVGISLVYLYSDSISSPLFYFMCFLIGSGTGYWALFVSIASELFGTNIRATVASTVPNFVRGAVVPITLGFKALEVSMGNTNSAVVVGAICLGLAFLGLAMIPETFGKDLNYVEE